MDARGLGQEDWPFRHPDCLRSFGAGHERGGIPGPGQPRDCFSESKEFETGRPGHIHVQSAVHLARRLFRCNDHPRFRSVAAIQRQPDQRAGHARGGPLFSPPGLSDVCRGRGLLDALRRRQHGHNRVQWSSQPGFRGWRPVELVPPSSFAVWYKLSNHQSHRCIADRNDCGQQGRYLSPGRGLRLRGHLEFCFQFTFHVCPALQDPGVPGVEGSSECPLGQKRASLGDFAGAAGSPGHGVG